jgi:DNA-binding MarR family transcriptional regulator
MNGEVEGKTVGEKILLNLSHYSRYQRDLVCPRAMTQQGIADRAGISRGHAAVELKRLLVRGHIASRHAHIPDVCLRLKVYHLTPLGEILVRQYRDMAAASVAVGSRGNGGLRDPGGRGGDPPESATA